MSLDNAQVLSGLKIIEIGRDVSTAFAARFFSIYGAEVIVVEPPKGHSIRWQPPWPEDIPDPEKNLSLEVLAPVGEDCLDDRVDEGGQAESVKKAGSLLQGDHIPSIDLEAGQPATPGQCPLMNLLTIQQTYQLTIAASRGVIYCIIVTFVLSWVC